MKAIIMAAGRGTRISRHLGSLPKCCLSVGRETIIERTIRSMLNYGVSDISVVLGYGADQVRNAIKSYPVKQYLNPFFDVTNSIASLWFARAELATQEDIVLMNADLFFEPILIEQVKKSALSPVLFADPRRKEEADYKLEYSGNVLAKYGKDLSLRETTGEYVGIAKIGSQFLSPFQARLEALIAQQRHSLWWEDVLYTLCSDNTTVSVEEVTECFWAEVDYVEDYERIQAYINKSKGS